MENISVDDLILWFKALTFDMRIFLLQTLKFLNSF